MRLLRPIVQGTLVACIVSACASTGPVGSTAAGDASADSAKTVLDAGIEASADVVSQCLPNGADCEGNAFRCCSRSCGVDSATQTSTCE
jgi:hypothetical protein